jgi:hypothetical protein
VKVAAGHGLVWNLGEKPVEGYTNFLWVIIAAVLVKLRLNILWLSQAVGIISGLLAIWCTHRFAWRFMGLSKRTSLVPCLFLALSGPFAAWAASGMETNLFALFVLMAAYYFVSFWKGAASKDLYLCFILLFFATLTRPEGFLIFGLIFVLSLLLALLNRLPLRSLLFPLLSYVIPFLAYFFWRYVYFGYLLPNTYYAKTGGAALQYLRGLEYVKYFAIYFLAPFLPVVLWFAASKRKSFFRRPESGSIAEHINKNLGLYSSLIILVAYTLYIIYVGGDYMAMYRFFVPVLPFIYIVFGFFMGRIAKLAGAPKLKAVFLCIFVFFAAAATFIQSTPLEKSFSKKPAYMHGTYRGVETERWHTARLALLGKFFDKYRNNAGESVASTAIGAISYYADMKIIDFFGLVDPYLAHQEIRNVGAGWPGHEKINLDYLFSKRPTYIMYRREFTTKPREMKEFWRHTIILNEYKVTAVWLKDKQNNEEGYFSFLELKENKHDPGVEKFFKLWE